MSRSLQGIYSYGWPAPTADSAGALPTINSGTAVTLEWACQDYQDLYYTQPGSCYSYDAFNNCNGWTGATTNVARYYQYGGSSGSNFYTANTLVGAGTEYPTASITYGVRCDASGNSNNPTWGSGSTAIPSGAWMTVTVPVNSVPAHPGNPSISAAAGTVPYNTSTGLFVTVPSSQAGWAACYLYGGPIYGNGTSFTPGSGTWSTGPLTSNTIFSVACSDNYYGWLYSNSVTVYAAPPAPIVTFGTPPGYSSTVNYGQGGVLEWSSSNTTACTVRDPANQVVGTGTTGLMTTAGLTASSNTYSLTCSGSGGSISVSASINVNPPVLSLTACNAAGECASPWVNPSNPAYLTYSSQSVGTCSITASPGGTIFSNTSGTSAATPPLGGSTTYTFSCTGAPTPTPITRTVSTTPACTPQSGMPLSGWAWSEHVGWLSLDCTTAYAALNWPGSHDTQNWGLRIESDSTITGYAWNDRIGWVKFGGLSSFPSGLNTTAQNARVVGSGTTAQLVGWARACVGTASADCSTMSNASGWDGWISLAGSTTDSGTYSANFGSNPSYLPQLSGAWMGTLDSGGFGWLSFNLNSLPSATCTLAAASFQAGSSTVLTYSSTNATSATFNQGLGAVTPNTTGTKTTPIILEPTLYTLSLTGPGGAGGCNVLAAPGTTGAYGCLSINSATCSPPQHQVRVQPGATASLYWNVQNVAVCAISGDNGQSWSGLASEGTQTTAAITRRTTFSLTCDGAQVDRATVVLVPQFQEI